MLSGIDPLKSRGMQKIPNDMDGYEWWQYGHGQNDSDRRRIPGAIPIT